MYKIGIVGPRERVMCFMAAGFTVYEAGDAESAAKSLRRAADDGCAVIYVVPSLATEIAGDANRPIPAVIPLPEAGGGCGITQMRSAVERAVGADIIFKEK